jgi:ArsR family transcriptional regulator
VITLKELINTIKAMSDEIRLRIINLLSHHEELCVCEMVDALGLPQSTISRHLTVLRNANLVEDRKKGLWVLYKLSHREDYNTMVKALIENELKRYQVFQEDLEALKRRLETCRGCSI